MISTSSARRSPSSSSSSSSASSLSSLPSLQGGRLHHRSLPHQHHCHYLHSQQPPTLGGGGEGSCLCTWSDWGEGTSAQVVLFIQFWQYWWILLFSESMQPSEPRAAERRWRMEAAMMWRRGKANGRKREILWMCGPREDLVAVLQVQSLQSSAPLQPRLANLVSHQLCLESTSFPSQALPRPLTS